MIQIILSGIVLCVCKNSMSAIQRTVEKWPHQKPTHPSAAFVFGFFIFKIRPFLLLKSGNKNVTRIVVWNEHIETVARFWKRKIVLFENSLTNSPISERIKRNLKWAEQIKYAVCDILINKTGFVKKWNMTKMFTLYSRFILMN